MLCEFCEKVLTTKMSLIQHQVRCVLNPNRKVCSEETRKRISDNTKRLFENPEYRKKVSDGVRKKVNEMVEAGTWHTSFKNTRRYEYKGTKLLGSWELAYAKWLDENNIKWRPVTETFKYNFEGKDRRYNPDFYLIEEGCYVEIKGYKTDKDEAKWEQFPEGLKLKVLRKKDLNLLGLKVQ